MRFVMNELIFTPKEFFIASTTSNNAHDFNYPNRLQFVLIMIQKIILGESIDAKIINNK